MSFGSWFLVVVATCRHCLAEDADRRLIYSYDGSDSHVPWSRFGDTFPYVVSIRFNNQHQCGGTLIRANWVLTAAHCFYTASSSLPKFEVWTWGSEQENHTNKTTMDLLVVHEKYHMVTLEHDIALVRLQDSYPYAPLVTLEKAVARHDGKQALIAGWGSLDAACNRYGTILKEGPTHIVTSAPCAAGNQFFNGTERICNEYINTTAKAISGAGCGDSGGPLFIDDSNGQQIQVGLVSYTSNMRDIFVRVFTYMDWINDILGNPPTTDKLVPPLCQGSCCDDAEYNDPFGKECGSYNGKDCTAEAEYNSMTTAETAELFSKCKSSCQRCPVCEATNSSCCDVVGFTTASGAQCDRFRGVNCASDADAATVLPNCPHSCGTCLTGTDCTDMAYFTDAKSHACHEWRGHDCNRAVEDWSYAQADEDLLLQSCPLSCGTCTPAPDGSTTTTLGDGLSASINGSGSSSVVLALAILAISMA